MNGESLNIYGGTIITGIIITLVAAAICFAVKKIMERVLDSRKEFVESLKMIGNNKKVQILEEAQNKLLNCWLNRIVHPRVRRRLLAGKLSFDEFTEVLKTRVPLFKYQAFKIRVERILHRVDFQGYPFAGYKYGEYVGVEENYDENLHECLSLRFRTAISAWAGDYYFSRDSARRMERGLDVLVLGQINVALATKVIRIILDTVSVKHVEIRFLGCSEVFKANIFKEFPNGEIPKTESGKELKILFSNKYGADYEYDIVISAHYWQHRSWNHIESFLQGKRVCSCALRENGMFVWASAISRNPVDNEFVCEGFCPSDVFYKRDSSDVALRENTFLQIGVYGAKPRKLYYSLHHALKNVPSSLALEFPVSVEYEESGISDKLIIESFAEEFLKSKGYSPSGIDISDPSCTSTSKFKVSDYYVVNAQWQDGDAEDGVTLIAAKGAGDVLASDGDIKRITFYIANRRRINESQFNEGNIARILNDHGVLERRIVSQLNVCIENDKTQRIARLLPRLGDAKESGFLLLLVRVNGRWEMVFAPLPIRQYLSLELHDRRLEAAKIGNPDLDVAISKRLGSASVLTFRPVSVTALLSYKSILDALKARNLALVDDSVFFYKAYHRLDNNGVKALLIDAEKQGLELTDIIDRLHEDMGSAARDNALNALPTQKRLSLLGAMNVHNVLLFAHKKKDTKLTRVNGYIKQYIIYCLTGIPAFIVDMSVMICIVHFAISSYSVYLGVGLGFVLGSFVNYLTSLWFVFNTVQERMQLSKVSLFFVFVGIGLVGAVMTEFGMYLLFGKIGMTYIFTKIIVAMPVSIWNFVGRKWVISRCNKMI